MQTSYAGRFLLASLAAFAYAAPTPELNRRDGWCNIAEQANVLTVGGQGGNIFCETKWPGPDLITGISTWSNGNDISAIEVSYASGATANYGGSLNGAASGTITLAPGELLTGGTFLTGNGKGTRLGKIHIETNKGQKVDLGTSSAQSYKMNVGSGLLIGVQGTETGTDQKAEIIALSLLFLGPKIDNIAVSGFNFDTDPTKNGPPISPQALDKVHYYNDRLAGNSSFVFTGTQTVTNTNTWTQSTTGSFGNTYSISFEVDILGLEKTTVGAEVTWSVEHTTESSNTVTNTNALTWTQSGELLPNHGVDCQAVVQTGSGDFPYTSTVTMSLDDGSTLSYPESGTLHSVQYSEIDSQCAPSNTQSSASGFQSGTVTPSS